jgi:hypothetical protein
MVGGDFLGSARVPDRARFGRLRARFSSVGHFVRQDKEIGAAAGWVGVRAEVDPRPDRKRGGVDRAGGLVGRQTGRDAHAIDDPAEPWPQPSSQRRR